MTYQCLRSLICLNRRVGVEVEWSPLNSRFDWLVLPVQSNTCGWRVTRPNASFIYVVKNYCLLLSHERRIAFLQRHAHCSNAQSYFTALSMQPFVVVWHRCSPVVCSPVSAGGTVITAQGRARQLGLS